MTRSVFQGGRPRAGVALRGGENGQPTVLGGNGGPGWKRSPLHRLFPSVCGGQPLISRPNEKLQFRFGANRRVFETTLTDRDALARFIDVSIVRMTVG